MKNSLLNKNRECGAATLIITVMLLVMSTLIVIFAANFGLMRGKTTDNISRNRQAFNAAEAGLEFGINYLRHNRTAITNTPVNGYIPNYTNASTTNVTLANGSRFSITYTNPIANNYTLIRITSVGTNDDNTATHTVMQDTTVGSLLLSPPNFPLVTKGNVTMSGNAVITNTVNNTSIQSASTVSMSGNSQTTLNSGTSSSAGNIQSDIQQNSASLANMSQDDFFATYFGSTTGNVQSNAAHYYSNTGNTNYTSTLNGMNGTSIWINQQGTGTASISGNAIIGSPSNPVLLIVNGSLSLSGNVTIYGFIFVIGTNDITSLSGNVNVIGGMGTSDTLNMSGNIQLTYDPTVINNLQNQASLTYFAKIPGSWRDF